MKPDKKYTFFDANLRCICPVCGVRNHPNDTHCSGCGTDLASEIKKRLAEMTQDKTWKAANRKKRLTAVWIISLVALIFLVFTADVLRRGSLIDPKQYALAANAAVQYGLTISPYKWEDPDGKTALLLIPDFTNAKESLSFKTLLFNQSGQQCMFLNKSIYAKDDLGEVYTTELPSLIQEDLVRLPDDKTRLVETLLYPMLSPDATTLTIYYPEFCGALTGSIVVDLSGQGVVVNTITEE
jgi:hypothetical protein